MSEPNTDTESDPFALDEDEGETTIDTETEGTESEGDDEVDEEEDEAEVKRQEAAEQATLAQLKKDREEEEERAAKAAKARASRAPSPPPPRAPQRPEQRAAAPATPAVPVPPAPAQASAPAPSLLARIRPHNAKKGQTMRSHSFLHNGDRAKFVEGFGWYEVSPSLGARLRTIRCSDMDPESNLAFDVCTPSEARKLEAREEQAKEMESRSPAKRPRSAIS